MGSLYSPGKSLEIITVSTDTLKDRLNQMYRVMRHHSPAPASAGLFEYLWDLKESALLQGRDSVQVPTNWLDELETDFMRNQLQQMH